MNIFATDWHPEISAKNLCDKHVVKMTLESAQILSTAHTESCDPLYKKTHKKHPCVLWAQQSIQNYCWLCQHALALCKEYTTRYGKIHRSEKVILWCIDNLPNLSEAVGVSEFAEVMPSKYKRRSSVYAYRLYYIGEKSKFAKWNKGRECPEWFLKGGRL